MDEIKFRKEKYLIEYPHKNPMHTTKKRIRLSFLVAKTQRMFFTLLYGIAIALACVYLFWLNHLAMQGYILTKITEESFQLTSELEQIDAKIAHFQTREYVTKMSDKNQMVQRRGQRFVVVKDVFTAQK